MEEQNHQTTNNSNSTKRSIEEVVANDYNFKIGDILSKSWSKISGLKLPFFLGFLFLCVVAIFIALMIFGQAIFGLGGLYINVSGFIILIIAIITPIILYSGLIVITLKHLRKETINFKKDFFSTVSMLHKLFLLNLFFLVIAICSIVPYALFAILMISILLGIPYLDIFNFLWHGNDFLHYIFGSIIDASCFIFDGQFGVIPALIAFLLLIPVIYLIYAYFLSPWIYIDNKGISIWKAMETSRKLVTKRWFKIFGLVFVVGLIVMISAIPFGIGFIWTMPFAYLCIGTLYQTIFEEK